MPDKLANPELGCKSTITKKTDNETIAARTAENTKDNGEISFSLSIPQSTNQNSQENEYFARINCSFKMLLSLGPVIGQMLVTEEWAVEIEHTESRSDCLGTPKQTR
jgi:hypothetical protein